MSWKISLIIRANLSRTISSQRVIVVVVVVVSTPWSNNTELEMTSSTPPLSPDLGFTTPQLATPLTGTFSHQGES